MSEYDLDDEELMDISGLEVDTNVGDMDNLSDLKMTV